jgi:hypothetical protein
MLIMGVFLVAAVAGLQSAGAAHGRRHVPRGIPSYTRALLPLLRSTLPDPVLAHLAAVWPWPWH